MPRFLLRFFTPERYFSVRLAILACLFAFPAWSQMASLSLGGAAGTPGSTVTVDLVLGGGVNVSGLQWDLNYPAPDLDFVGSQAGAQMVAAGKSLRCSGTGGRTTCLVFGLNQNSISSGVVASVQLAIASTTTAASANLALSGLLASAPDSGAIPVSGGASIVTIQSIPNSNPVAPDQSLQTSEDTPLNILLQASDVDGDPLTFQLTSQPSHGSITGTAPSLTYSPASDYHGPDSFTFDASDGKGGSDSGTVSVSVAAVNDPPQAQDGNASTPEDVPVSITLNASDPDGDALSFNIVAQPAHGALSGVAPNLTYTPTDGYSGPDSFSFEVSDNNGGTDTGLISIIVTDVNGPPTAGDDSVTILEDTPAVLELSASDPDNDPLNFSLASGPSFGTLTGSLPSAVYTPNDNFHGADSFVFRVADPDGESDTGICSIVVDPVNDAPTVLGQELVAQQGIALPFTLEADDLDGDPITFLVLDSPSNGSLVGAGPEFTYTSNGGFEGDDSFTIQASDSSGATAVGVVSVRVQSVLLISSKAAVFSAGTWMVDNNDDGSWEGPPEDREFQLDSLENAVPVVGDWNGSGTTKAGLFADGVWMLDFNGNGVWDGPGADRLCSIGKSGDIPIVGDWDGSGSDQIGVYRSGKWKLDWNGNCLWDGQSLDRLVSGFGTSSSTPVVGDWDGTGFDKIGIYKSGLWSLDWDGDGVWEGGSIDRSITLGGSRYVPVVGDWNGSGSDKAGVYNSRRRRPVWKLDFDGNGVWDKKLGDRNIKLGATGDVPVVGDWGGTGSTKIGVFSHGIWQLDFDGNGKWTERSADRLFVVGQEGDIPVPGRW